MEAEAEPFENNDDPSALERRVLEILRVAKRLPQGPLRREALAEVNRLRQQAIELHRRTAADLKAQIDAIRRDASGHDDA